MFEPKVFPFHMRVRPIAPIWPHVYCSGLPFCGVPSAAGFFFELEYVWVYPSHVVYHHGWHGFNRMLKGNMCIYEPTRSTPQKISRPQCSLSPWRFWVATISKISTFEAPNFSQSFSPLGSLGFCLRAWAGPRGRGSRGDTPLHYAANCGHVSAVERLLEAKAAVDAQNEDCRGLGRGFAGENVVRQWDGCEEMDEMLIWFMVQGFGGFLFLLLVESVSQDMCTDILCFFIASLLSAPLVCR